MAKETIKRMDDWFDGRRQSGNMHVEDIIVDATHNSRNYKLPDNRQHLDNLKADILKNGVLVPVLVRFDENKKVVLVDGESRYKAVQELNQEGHEEILLPVVRGEAKTAEESLELSLSANSGKPFHQFEAGSAFKRFIKFGWTPEKIAERFAKTERFVRDAIELSDAPQTVLESLASGEISVMVALRIIRNNETAAAQKAAVKAVTEKAKSEGKKGPAKAEYKKRNLTVKVPTPLFKKVVKLLAQYDDDEFVKLYSQLEPLLPSGESKSEKKGAAAKLEDF